MREAPPKRGLPEAALRARLLVLAVALPVPVALTRAALTWIARVCRRSRARLAVMLRLRRGCGCRCGLHLRGLHLRGGGRTRAGEVVPMLLVRLERRRRNRDRHPRMLLRVRVVTDGHLLAVLAVRGRAHRALREADARHQRRDGHCDRDHRPGEGETAESARFVASVAHAGPILEVHISL